MSDILIAVPPRVLGQVQRALAALHRWNAAIAQVRRTEAVAQAPGRYEYDLRYTQAGAQYRLSLAQAQETLARFEALAQANGVDPAAVYAACGGKPELVDEGPHVQAWAPRTA